MGKITFQNKYTNEKSYIFRHVLGIYKDMKKFAIMSEITMAPWALLP